MTVYVITKGTYSDYRICAVALDESKAKRLARAHSDMYEKANVEVYETESEANVNMLNGRKPYYVYFHEGRNPFVYCMAGTTEFDEHIIENTHNKNPQAPPTMRVALYAENEEKALKIAQDKRAKYLAEKTGIT